MDLISGPDGGVFLADWSDTGECHDNDGVHRTSGRIYKLIYGQPKRVEPFDLTKLSSAELYAMLGHSNNWHARQARRLLQERILSGGIDPAWIQAHGSSVNQKLKSQPFSPTTLFDLWSVPATKGPESLKEFLTSDDEHVASWAVRLLVDECSPEGKQLPRGSLAALLQAAKDQSSGLVLLYLASALQRLPLEERWPIAEVLVSKEAFAGDPRLRLMIWYAIEPAVPHDPARAITLLTTAKMPLVRENVARRITLEIESQPQFVEALVSLATNTHDPAFMRDVIVGMSKALHGWRKAPIPPGWAALSAVISKSAEDETKSALHELSIVFGDGRALDELRAVALNRNAEPEARRQSIRTLLAGKPADFAPTLHDFLNDYAIVVDVLRGLALYDHPATPERILAATGYYSPDARTEMINTLASRPSYAKALMQALREKKIAPSEVSAFHARQIGSFEDAELTAELNELWGDVRVTADDKRALMNRLKSQLSADTLTSANLSAGRAMFQKTCANCHVLYGVGRKVGPDLTGSNRKNIDYLLENIVDPSASVGADFRVRIITLEDGRVLSGVVSEQNERTLTLETPQGQVTVDRKEIEETQQSTNSLMPDGQLQNLTAEEIRDLIGYLMSTNQVPLANQPASPAVLPTISGGSINGLANP